ncbi:MAG: hypothetical protein ACE37F_14240 [Nannocystaceae bacterium]|nr:hypothetical protein [bacterium]
MAGDPMTDPRIVAAVESLEGEREGLRVLAQVDAPTMRGIAAALRDHGFDAYSRVLDDVARRIASSCSKTRRVVEQLSTLTDPRLEQTDPRIPPPDRGAS